MAFTKFHLFSLLVGSLLAYSFGRATTEPPVLRVSLESEPTTLDWHASRSATDRFLITFLMRGMLKYDGAGNPVCDLCKSFSVSNDGKTYHFELNSTEVWSDGEKLEASQFSDSFKRLLNPANRFKNADDYRIIAGASQGGKSWDPKKLEVRAASKTDLEILLTEPVSTFAHLMTRVSTFPVRKDFIKPITESQKGAGVGMASGPVLGPYQLAAWERGRRLVIEGSQRFTGNRPVYRVDFHLGRHADQLRSFKAGHLDILSAPTTEDILQLHGQNIQLNPYWATRLLLFNFRRTALSTPALRSAILYSLDRNSLPSRLKNGERPVTGLVPPSMPGHRELPLVTADSARARAEINPLLRPGASFELELLIRDTEGEKAVARWLQDELVKIKILLKIKAVNTLEYYNQLDAGTFDLALRTWTFEIASPLDILKTFQSESSANKGHWNNVAYDSMFNQMLHEQNPATLKAQVDRISQFIEVQEVAVIPLGYPTQPFLLGRRVMSFGMTPFGDPDLIRVKLKQ